MDILQSNKCKQIFKYKIIIKIKLNYLKNAPLFRFKQLNSTVVFQAFYNKFKFALLV